jgi:hypothetical protein
VRLACVIAHFDANIPPITLSLIGATRAAGATREGAVLRVRPKAMTVAVIIASLLPILWGSGTGSEVMSRHRRSDGRWHGHRAAAVHAGDSGGLSVDEEAGC